MGNISAKASAEPLRIKRGSRVTVLRRACFPDLQDLYLEDPESGPCDSFATGETFDISNGCPPGFCPRAWSAIQRAIDDASHCPGNPGENGTIIASCPDGTRPVIFKIEL
ncbi:MAG: TIGR04076 family protein [Muribaculaceae bacterium]|nr:TIGR04076 family protein [Muribaculaceae bacterium]